MIRFILVFIVCIAFITARAQYIEKQVGLRIGATSGISAKVIKNDRQAYEGIVALRQGGIQIYGLIESYRPLMIDFKHDLRIYFGGGGHLGFVNGKYKSRWWYNPSGGAEDYRVSGAVIGIDGIIGGSYHFRGFPMSVGIESKPFLELQAFQHLVFDPLCMAFFLKWTL